jgi:hypothetical protein
LFGCSKQATEVAFKSNTADRKFKVATWPQERRRDIEDDVFFFTVAFSSDALVPCTATHTRTNSHSEQRRPPQQQHHARSTERACRQAGLQDNAISGAACRTMPSAARWSMQACVRSWQ